MTKPYSQMSFLERTQEPIGKMSSFVHSAAQCPTDYIECRIAVECEPENLRKAAAVLDRIWQNDAMSFKMIHPDVDPDVWSGQTGEVDQTGKEICIWFHKGYEQEDGKIYTSAGDTFRGFLLRAWAELHKAGVKLGNAVTPFGDQSIRLTDGTPTPFSYTCWREKDLSENAGTATAQLVADGKIPANWQQHHNLHLGFNQDYVNPTLVEDFKPIQNITKNDATSFGITPKMRRQMQTSRIHAADQQLQTLRNCAEIALNVIHKEVLSSAPAVLPTEEHPIEIADVIADFNWLFEHRAKQLPSKGDFFGRQIILGGNPLISGEKMGFSKIYDEAERRKFIEHDPKKMRDVYRMLLFYCQKKEALLEEISQYARPFLEQDNPRRLRKLKRNTVFTTGVAMLAILGLFSLALTAPPTPGFPVAVGITLAAVACVFFLAMTALVAKKMFYNGAKAEIEYPLGYMNDILDKLTAQHKETHDALLGEDKSVVHYSRLQHGIVNNAAEKAGEDATLSASTSSHRPILS